MLLESSIDNFSLTGGQMLVLAGLQIQVYLCPMSALWSRYTWQTLLVTATAPGLIFGRSHEECSYFAAFWKVK